MPSNTPQIPTRNGADTTKVRLVSIEDLDRRTRVAHLCRQTRADVAADLGGEDQLSTLERQAVSHVALLDAMITDLGVRWLKGERVDPGALATLQNVFNRTATVLGWERRKKDVTPTVEAYLSHLDEVKSDA